MDARQALDAVDTAVGVVSFVAALAVLLLGPRRAVTYLLAALLAFFPIRDVTSRVPEWIAQDLWSYNAAVLWVGVVFLFLPLQLAFVARAIDSPVTRWLRSRRAGIALALVGILAFALPFLFHEVIFVGTEVGGSGGRDWAWHPALTFVSPFTYIAAAAFGLVAALDAVWRAPHESLTRRRAKAYLAAFLLWDVGMLLGSADFLLEQGGADPASVGMLALGFAYTTLFLLFPFLLARALLRDHLFDFDLKLKWTIRRGTLVGIFVAVFFVAGAIAEQWLQQYGVVFGGAAVGLLLFALRPLERAADRLANAAMPGVDPTPAYVAHKKLEVYKAAVESAHETGGIDAREQAALERLRQKLGIAEPDARAVERDVVGTPTS